MEEHTIYSHNEDLHQWLDKTITQSYFNQPNNTPLPPPLLLYEFDYFLSTVDHATLLYQKDIILFLISTEWRTTLKRHPTRTPTHSLNAPFTGWHIYTPDITHIPGSLIPPYKHYIDTFR